MGRDDEFFPPGDDGYECGLDEATKAVALAELREDEATRSRAIGQLREWVLAHPAIRRCRTDSVFLLRFLRSKKFSVPLAQEMLERYLTVRQLYPLWFRGLSADEPVVREILLAGYLVPLPERDDLGRRVVLRRAASIDPSRHTSAHVARVHALAMECLLEEEASQVRGFVQLNDESGLSARHLSMWSLADIARMTKCFQKSFPIRHKSSKFLCLPHYASKIMEFFISLLSEKMRSRIEILPNMEDLRKVINPKILPKEYGGEVPLDQMINVFLARLEAGRDALRSLDDTDIDLDRRSPAAADLEGELAGVAGSFRRLEVD
ncbi:clavesin-1-like [Bacillus rossius redtenbacheri]|uniref:clavesin-1-like n=1 Tax=Bacillus rossius redtenbacheri TaxID=93214 RepID=UPI002FDE4484